LEFALAAVYVKLSAPGDECLGIAAKDGIMSLAIHVRGGEIWLMGCNARPGISGHGAGIFFDSITEAARWLF
jgi:hypothetical protein